MRIFLITIFVTTVSATNENDLKHAQENEGSGVKYSYLPDITFYNLHLLTEYEMLFVDSNTEIHFQIKENESNSKRYCGSRPGFSLRSEPDFCLLKIIFNFYIKDGKDTIQLGLLFRNYKNTWDWKLVVADVFPREPRMTYLTPGAKFVTIFTTDIIEKLKNKESFRIASRWLQKILVRGMIALDSESEMKLVPNLADKEIPVYYAEPVAIDEKVIPGIKELPMLRPKSCRHDAEAGTSLTGIPLTKEDLIEFDKMFE